MVWETYFAHFSILEIYNLEVIFFGVQQFIIMYILYGCIFYVHKYVECQLGFIQINMRKMIIMICLVTYYYSLQVHIELQIFFCANFCHYIQVFLSQILQMRIIRSLVSFNSIFIMNVINSTITKSQKDRLVEKALDFME